MVEQMHNGLVTITCDGQLDNGSACGVPGPVGMNEDRTVQEAFLCGWDVLFDAALCPACSEAGRTFVPLGVPDVCVGVVRIAGVGPLYVPSDN